MMILTECAKKKKNWGKIINWGISDIKFISVENICFTRTKHPHTFLQDYLSEEVNAFFSP